MTIIGEETLRECPFCGSDDLIVQFTGAADEWWHNVFCDHCCTYGPTAATEAEAIDAWNTRSPEAVTVKALDDAKDAFEAIKELADADETLLCWKTANDALAALLKVT